MFRLKSFFKVKFRSVVLGFLLYHNGLHVAPKVLEKIMNNEKTKFVRQVAKVDLV
jgi:hypothetical protein